MKDRDDVFFKGGFIVRDAIIGNDEEAKKQRKTCERKMRQIAKKARLPFSGMHVAITTQAALRRAKGAGIEKGKMISKKMQKALIAAGMRPEKAKKLTWESMWT